MLRLTDVVKNLLIINIIVFVAVKFLIPIPGLEKYFILVYPGLELFDYPTQTTYTFEPIQIITHLFYHANFQHLFFNMIGLYMLGPYVEASIGPKRFLTMYFICGFAASIAQMFLTQGAILGASGAIYGILAAFATMFPNLQLMLLFPPIPIKAKYLALGLIVIGLFSGVTGAQAGIGHFAHVGGAITGFICIRYWGFQNLR